MKIKSIFFLTSLIIAAVFFVGCSKSAGTSAEQKLQNTPKEKIVINIAYQPSSKTVLVAKAKGWFEEEFGKDGIEIKYGLFLSGPPMMEALATDRMDFATTGDMPPVASKAAGVDIKVIGNGGREIGSSKLIVPANSSIKSVQDLKGKKVATQIGSGAHHYIALLLKKNGLALGDVNLVNLAATEWQNALTSGNVDAVATWEPWGTTLINANAGKEIFNSKGIKDSPSVLLVRNGFAQKNPILVERFLKVNQRVMEYIKNNPDEALEKVSKETKLPIAVLAPSYKNTQWELNINSADIYSFKQVKDFLRETNIIKRDYDIESLFDLHYLGNIGVK